MPLVNFAGIASGIDTTGIIKATSDATRAARVNPLEKQVSELTETNAAYSELKTKLTELQSITLNFATINGGAVSKTGASTDETVATASASNAAANGSYSINVISRAKNHTHSFDDRFSSTSDKLVPLINDGDPAADRTVTYTIGNGTDQKTISVVLDSNTTVSSFVSSFNQAAASAGNYATATAVQVGTAAVPSYAIVITTNNEGTQKGQVASVSVGASVTGQARFSGTSQEDPATDATFTVTGINGTITRYSNKVSDVIPGVNLNFVNTGSATITVTEDVSATSSKVQDFVDAFNEIITFINENNAVRREEDGEDVTNVFSPLAKTRTDDNALSSLRNAIVSSSYSSGSAVKIFADFGVTTERDGTLKFDSDKFETALSTEPSSVNQILANFGDKVALTKDPSTNNFGVIHQYIGKNLLIDISTTGNTNLMTSLNDKIADAEASIARAEEQMRARFARLEGTMGRLQSQQASLASALAGLGSR
jgi:flagellar hook-associated protein 2